MAIIQDLIPESNGAERFSYLTFSRINAIIFWLMQHASVAQSVVHLTRNEKVACSSQVTSSKKVLEPQRFWDFSFFLKYHL